MLYAGCLARLNCIVRDSKGGFSNPSERGKPRRKKIEFFLRDGFKNPPTLE